MNKKITIASTLFCSTFLMWMNYGYAAPPPEIDPDWPCDQILVPEVAAAVVWAGPSVKGLREEWQQHKDVNELVQRISQEEVNPETVDSEVAAFASKQQPERKDHILTLLFAGVHDVLNSQRGKMLSGIKRYSRGQAARAERLGNEMDEMIHLESDNSPAAQERLRMMKKELELKQRMFDEREDFIQYLCARPVVIEQRLGMLARTIAAYLD